MVVDLFCVLVMFLIFPAGNMHLSIILIIFLWLVGRQLLGTSRNIMN